MISISRQSCLVGTHSEVNEIFLSEMFLALLKRLFSNLASQKETKMVHTAFKYRKLIEMKH